MKFTPKRELFTICFCYYSMKIIWILIILQSLTITFFLLFGEPVFLFYNNYKTFVLLDIELDSFQLKQIFLNIRGHYFYYLFEYF